MPNHPITTIQELKEHLHVAMQLEHATIPPYLLALYTICPDTNPEATRILRTVVVEEMLHLSLAANLLNAVGGHVDLTIPGFVPCYPAPLPAGVGDFKVSLRPFSKQALETFLQIERPAKAPSHNDALVPLNGRKLAFRMHHPGHPNDAYYSIGEFYKAIAEGLETLNRASLNGGPKLFCSIPENQVGPEYYYSGGAKLLKVYDLETALTAVNTIIEQGEGFDKGVFSDLGELAHDYRFEQLKLERYYLARNEDGKPDEAGYPTGPELKVEWDKIYPAKVNARLIDYEPFPEIHAAAVNFNREYFEFLGLLTKAFNGQPELLLSSAVPRMFALRNLMLQLVHVPLPNDPGVNAAPTFEMPYAGPGCPPAEKPCAGPDNPPTEVTQ
jgi:hypothetical protein